MIAQAVAFVLRRLVIARRPPDLIIGGAEDPYMHRWYLIRSRFGAVYLHWIIRDDDDVPHDHPWHNASFVLENGFFDCRNGKRLWLKPGSFMRRIATVPHRIELRKKYGRPIPALSLFFMGKKIREWGFHCPNRWIPWREFVGQTEGLNDGRRGRGCGEAP